MREHGFYARTVGLKMSAPSATFTRDVTLDEPTDLDTVIFRHVLDLFQKTFQPSQKVRLLGVRASHLESVVFQKNLLELRKGSALAAWREPPTGFDRVWV